MNDETKGILIHIDGRTIKLIIGSAVAFAALLFTGGMLLAWHGGRDTMAMLLLAPCAGMPMALLALLATTRAQTNNQAPTGTPDNPLTAAIQMPLGQSVPVTEVVAGETGDESGSNP